jgi:hypothetical protein
MSQNEDILLYLTNGGRLTPLDAMNLFGCTRLAARIGDLRDKGHQIESRTVKKGNKRFAEYRMHSEPVQPALF